MLAARAFRSASLVVVVLVAALSRRGKLEFLLQSCARFLFLFGLGFLALRPIAHPSEVALLDADGLLVVRGGVAGLGVEAPAPDGADSLGFALGEDCRLRYVISLTLFDDRWNKNDYLQRERTTL